MQDHFGASSALFFRCPSGRKNFRVCAEFLPAEPPKGPRSPLNSRCDALSRILARRRRAPPLQPERGLSRATRSGPCCHRAGSSGLSSHPGRAARRIKLAELRLLLSPSDIFALSHSGRNVKLPPAIRSVFSLVVDLPSRSGITWASLREGSAGYCQGG